MSVAPLHLKSCIIAGETTPPARCRLRETSHVRLRVSHKWGLHLWIGVIV